MKQLTCEMCGSTDLMKQNGVFVCQTCGTKYSVEEAKKMMVEGTVNVAGTVKVDHSDQIAKYMAMAQNAYDSKNLSEAELYCNKIIEIDPNDADAWMLKGKSAGWQTTKACTRISEAAKCFANCVMLSSTEKVTMDLNVAGMTMKVSKIPKEYNAQQCYEELVRLAKAIINLHSSFVIEYTDEEDCIDLDNTMVECLNAIIDEFIDKTDADVTFTYLALANTIVECVTNVISQAYAAINKAYFSEKTPDQNCWEKYRNRIGNINKHFRKNFDDLHNIALNSDSNTGKLNPEEYITYLNTLIYNITETIENDKKRRDSCSWTWKYIDYQRDMPGGFNRVMNIIKSNGGIPDPDSDGYYLVEYSLTEAGKKAIDDMNKSRYDLINVYKEQIKKAQAMIDEKLNAEKQERIDAYWKEHADEKNQLETELANLKSEADSLEKQLPPINTQINSIRSKSKQAVPSESEKETVQKEINKLQDEFSKLGMFKGKEKKSIQAQIDELKSRIPSIDKSITDERNNLQNECNNQIKPLQSQYNDLNSRLTEKKKRIAEIEEELTKDR